MRSGHPDHHEHSTSRPAADQKEPVYGMSVLPENAAASVEPIATSFALKTEYVCPMHPEVLRSEPGSCPICGMALEPRTVTGEEPDNSELRNMTRRLWISTVISAPLFLLTMDVFCTCDDRLPAAATCLRLVREDKRFAVAPVARRGS